MQARRETRFLLQANYTSATWWRTAYRLVFATFSAMTLYKLQRYRHASEPVVDRMQRLEGSMYPRTTREYVLSNNTMRNRTWCGPSYTSVTWCCLCVTIVSCGIWGVETCANGVSKHVWSVCDITKSALYSATVSWLANHARGLFRYSLWRIRSWNLRRSGDVGDGCLRPCLV